MDTFEELIGVNEFIATEIMGLRPCNGWQYVNFGSAGGPALMKECTHGDGECYSIMTIQSMNGPIGGTPRYDSIWNYTKELIQKLRSKSVKITIVFDKEVVVVSMSVGDVVVEVGAPTEYEAVSAAAVLLWKKASLSST